MMSFPIAVAAAALGANFHVSAGATTPAGSVGQGVTSSIVTGCPSTAAETALLPSDVANIFSGADTNWDQVTGTGAWNWSGCNLPITRIVRGDISGTTQEMKTYLRSIDPTDSSSGGYKTSCDSSSWTTLASYPDNTLWPGSGGTCTVTNLETALGTGGGTSCTPSGASVTTAGVICALASTSGGVTYGDLSNWKSTSDVTYVELQPNSGGAAQLAGSSATLGIGTPNCDTAFSANEPGTGNTNDFVGMDGSGTTPALTNWGTDASDGSGGVTQAADITNIAGSSTWPICTLTYDMVYSGLDGSSGTAIDGMNADQRRTLYTFFMFALSPDGQNLLKGAGYLPLPSSWASEERLGFNNNF